MKDNADNLNESPESVQTSAENLPSGQLQETDAENETQADAKTDAEKDASVNEAAINAKALSWANWRIFVLPAKIQSHLKKLLQTSSEENPSAATGGEEEKEDFDRFIPTDTTDKIIGVLDYIRHENATLAFDELLCVDIVLERNDNLSPFTPGIARYDDWGILQLTQNLRNILLIKYFRLTSAQRKKKWDSCKQYTQFSPEYEHRLNQLKILITVRKPKNAPIAAVGDDNDEELPPVWPDNLDSTDLKLFKIMSGLETFSPRRLALDTLDLLLDDLPQHAAEYRASRMKLNKRFPKLKKRNPYLDRLLAMCPTEVKLSAATSGKYSTASAHPAPFYFPAWFEKQASSKWYYDLFFRCRSILTGLLLTGGLIGMGVLFNQMCKFIIG